MVVVESMVVEVGDKKAVRMVIQEAVEVGVILSERLLVMVILEAVVEVVHQAGLDQMDYRSNY